MLTGWIYEIRLDGEEGGGFTLGIVDKGPIHVELDLIFILVSW